MESTGSAMKVGRRFSLLQSNLRLTPAQRSDGQAKHRGVRKCLNQHYWSSSSSTSNSGLVGSWGKDTAIRPPRDIDVLFVLPQAVKERIDNLPWGRNGQSELLQEVKNVLHRSYPTTTMRGDGQVVMVKFGSYAVEVIPAFRERSLFGGDTGRYVICNTHDGGKWAVADYVAEENAVTESNKATSGNTCDLVRMLKRWQGYSNVPIKSFVLELLARDFLASWPHSGSSTVYYDWMVRDFLGYLCSKGALSWVTVPGTGEWIWLGTAWKTKAEMALLRARKACDHESADRPCSAGSEWQKIFGDFIPQC